MLYPKIQSPFKRNAQKEFIPEFSHLVFEFLFKNQFNIYEKMDGFNVRVYWDGTAVRFDGKSNNTEFTPKQILYLTETFPSEKFSNLEPCYLFGELIGDKCHTNRYNLPHVEFILFDSYRILSSCWQSDEFILYLSELFSVRCAEKLGEATLEDMSYALYKTQKLNQETPYSQMFPAFLAEGVILRPATCIFLPNGKRIITKLKFSDKYAENFDLF